MGLKTKNYELKELNITIENAYAKISSLTITSAGKAYAIFNIQQDRESTESLEALELINFACDIDKTLPVHEQVYIKAKENLFKDWDDDIVIEEPVVEEEATETDENVSE